MRRPFLRHAQRTTRAVLQELTTNQELIAVLTAQWGDYGLRQPNRASASTHRHAALLWGGYYPVAARADRGGDSSRASSRADACSSERR